jgi:hypothetical protein
VLIDGHGFVKIADLGYAKLAKGKRTYSTLGTVTYTPPELVGGRGRTKAADWWGCGVLLHEMLTGEAPFVGDTPGEVLRKVQLYADVWWSSGALLRGLQVGRARDCEGREGVRWHGSAQGGKQTTPRRRAPSC